MPHPPPASSPSSPQQAVARGFMGLAWLRPLAEGSASRTSRLAWMAVAVVLLTLSFAPFYQFYLAWIVLVPWLLVVGRARNIARAFAWGWLSGVLFYTLNLWWLWTASISGMVVLVLYLALYWGLAAALVRALALVPGLPRSGDATPRWQPLVNVMALAALWVVAEWLRCYAVPGLAWMPLGNSQTPWLVVCQVADLGGPWIISFWVMALNGLVALAWVHGVKSSGVRVAALTMAGLMVLVAGYGAWRIASSELEPGITATVVQSNIPHLPGGARSLSDEQATAQLLRLTREALDQQETDLVVFPEAAFPPINDETRQELARAPIGPFLEQTYQELRQLASRHEATLVVGISSVLDWQSEGAARVGTRFCNSAFLIPPNPAEPAERYDKICLVPFSEQVPFPDGPAWLSRLALRIAADRASQPMHAGTLDQATTFTVRNDEGRDVRIVVPICLENIDPVFLTTLTYDPREGAKRADVLVNLSNDGWFAWQERHQHLQAMPLRCIENRMPMARSSNTGISALLDSTGRVIRQVASGKEGYSTGELRTDARVTIYQRFRHSFVMGCAAYLVLISGGVVLRRSRKPQV